MEGELFCASLGKQVVPVWYLWRRLEVSTYRALIGLKGNEWMLGSVRFLDSKKE